MSDLRPSAGEVDGAAQLLASVRARVAAAAADLALPDRLRLTEWQRTTVSALMARLVRTIEDELRSALVDAVEDETIRAALASARLEIALPILEQAGALADALLVEALLRRAEEHRLYRAGRADNALLIELAGDADAAVAGEAMGLMIAQVGRFDAFHEPLLARSDLPAELEHHLVWLVAAALRTYMATHHGTDPAAADEAISTAAAKLLSAYDEGETVEARCLRLARALRAAGRLDDGIAIRALEEGSLPLFVAFVADRTGLAADSVWEILSARAVHGIVLLLRAADFARREAASALLALSSGEADVPVQLDAYDTLTAEAARRRLVLWRADPGYRLAVARLAS